MGGCCTRITELDKPALTVGGALFGLQAHRASEGRRVRGALHLLQMQPAQDQRKHPLAMPGHQQQGARPRVLAHPGQHKLSKRLPQLVLALEQLPVQLRFEGRTRAAATQRQGKEVASLALMQLRLPMGQAAKRSQLLLQQQNHPPRRFQCPLPKRGDCRRP